MRFDVVSLFPDMFSVVRDQGVTGRAHEHNLWSLHTWNPRQYAHDVHKTVDDRPYGGGPGMVMQAYPLESAVKDAQGARGDDCAPVILMSPTGQPFDQAQAHELSQGHGAILICGRYEGVDQRFIDRCVTRQISLGDFVLSGGEIAALAVIDAVVRLLPGALGHNQSALQDSFNTGLTGLLDSPHYTRPECYQGLAVPEVLLSGKHAHIATWRRQQSLLITQRHRPELIVAARQAGLLSRADEAFLAEHADCAQRPAG